MMVGRPVATRVAATPLRTASPSASTTPVVTRRSAMTRLSTRLQHLERQAGTHARCHCFQMIRDDELAPPLCPHGRPLRHEWEDGHLIFQLAVENMDPALVAAERGTSPRMLTELLRDAVDALAVEYEDIANMSLDPRRAEGVRPALTRKRR